jgi:hypothetical protein
VIAIAQLRRTAEQGHRLDRGEIGRMRQQARQCGKQNDHGRQRKRREICSGAGESGTGHAFLWDFFGVDKDSVFQ